MQSSSVIYPLFSTPVYYVQNTGFEVDTAIVNTLLDRTKFPNWIESSGLSKNMFILDDPEFKTLRATCEFHLQEYVSNVCGLTNDFYITNSWVSRNDLNVDHTSHIHPNSIFSGCFYLQSSSQSNLTFSSVNHLSKSWPLAFNLDRINIYNADNWSLPVDTGAIVIFPSNILHGSNPSPSNETRVVLCFNTFIRGDLTSANYSTSLVLK